MNLLNQLIQLALYEDSGFGDVTSENILGPDLPGKGIIVAKEPMVIAGIDVASTVFKMLNPEAVTTSLFSDGDQIEKDDIVFTVECDLVNMLKGERVALNFMQRLSGIATLTRQFMIELTGLPVRLTDTRKTTPGWRLLEKAAVRAGGACNHRMSLYDGVLIKDNHIAVAGGIKNAVNSVRSKMSHLMKIEVETSTFDEVEEALEAGADIIMLDNMTIAEMKKAVKIIRKRALVEASGNVTLENVRTIAGTGVDLISSGALTHQARAMDLSMRISQ